MTTETPVTSQEPSKPAPPRKRRRLGWLIGLGLAAVAAYFFWARLPRSKPAPATDPAQQSGTVAVTRVVRRTLSDRMTVQADFHPYQDIAVHAKVSGYVKTIRVDIGDRVKAGDLLADLEIPELQDNLNRANADVQASEQEVARAEADYTNAHLLYQRLLDVARGHPNLVAQQDIDNAKAKDAAALGALGAAKERRQGAQAEVARVNTMIAYSHITAPFSGIITRRFADVGALIQAGTASNTQAMPLVQLAQDDLLRLWFPVPEAETPLIEDGRSVEVTVPALNDAFRGTITRYAWQIDLATRNMTTEVDVKNPEGRIKAGMYAYVKLPLREAKDALVVPVQALSTTDPPDVLVLNAAGTLERHEVTVGLRTANEAEIRSGLNEGDEVVIGNRADLRPGEKATPKLTDPPQLADEG